MSRISTLTYQEAEALCYHCGSAAGAVRTASRGIEAGMVFVGDNGARRIKGLTDVRCPRCSGPLFLDEFQTRYYVQPVRLVDDPHRRGRPPKRLVEMRRAAAGERLSA
ncbi:MAG: hypothetical protein IT307_00435 [Chloroflexi bacterium]|nr:hypothetical protein [Chloroflexota bacterium]